jgi:tetratricopeptide (TPR) repeat protein
LDLAVKLCRGNYPKAIVKKGDIYMAQERYEEAIRIYTKAGEVNE